MKPPKKIRVGPFTYEVVVDQAAIDREGVEEGDSRVGSCDLDGQRIIVSPKLAKDQMKDTIWHEVLHGVSDQVGVSVELGSENEERFIRRMATATLDLMQRNPKLLAYLTEKEV